MGEAGNAKKLGFGMCFFFLTTFHSDPTLRAVRHATSLLRSLLAEVDFAGLEQLSDPSFFDQVESWICFGLVTAFYFWTSQAFWGCRMTCREKPKTIRPKGELRIPMSWVIFNISAVDPKADGESCPDGSDGSV